MVPLFSCDKPRFSLKAGWRLSKALRRNFRSLQHAPLLRGSPWAQHSLGFAGGCNQQTWYTTFLYTYVHMYYTYIIIGIYIYIRATPGFCPGVAAYISTIHKQMILQITVIPMGKITKVLGTIKQTRSKHPKFLWEKQKQHSI